MLKRLAKARGWVCDMDGTLVLGDRHNKGLQPLPRAIDFIEWIKRRGLPFVLCLGLSCPDVADNALGDLVYKTGKHTAPLFAGDTVFAATEILGKRELPGRPDLGVLETRLFGYKPKAKQSAERVQIFELDREIVVKRRSHYA